jgi:hypothetical protein
LDQWFQRAGVLYHRLAQASAGLPMVSRRVAGVSSVLVLSRGGSGGI